MSAVTGTHFLSSCMDAPIASTVEAIRGLRSPVARTCHVGNNTSNNWGWLALAQHTYMVQFDHTLYGVDEVCAAWTVMGDGGVVDAFYDPRGEPVAEAAGRHLSATFALVDRRHTSHLNYGLRAAYQGADLMSRHYALAQRLAEQMNGSRVSMDSLEVLASQELLRRAITALVERGMLLGVFNRWVKASKRGHVTLQKIAAAEPLGGGRVRLVGMGAERFFEGRPEELLERLFEGMRRVSRRLVTGSREEWVDYPWFALGFNYLTQLIKEQAADPAQRTFWHAGGSASAYYVNDESFRRDVEGLRAALVEIGALHPEASLRMVPILGAQLFATSPRSLEALEALLDAWEACARSRPEEVEAAVAGLGRTTTPVTVVEELCRGLSAGDLERLGRCVAEFNDAGVNHLPVAHASKVPGPTYTKYGVRQDRLLGVRPIFPERLGRMRWGEAELLVKVLARMLSDVPG